VRDKDIQKIGKEERGFKRNQDEKVRVNQSLGKKKLERKNTLIFNVPTLCRNKICFGSYVHR
jgi:hypothetical protein